MKNISLFCRIAIITSSVLMNIAVAYAESGPFADIPENSPYYVPTKFLHEQNLLTHFSDGNFYPQKTITRAEALAMILTVSGKKFGVGTSSDFEYNAKNPTIIILPKSMTITVQNLLTGEKTDIQNVNDIQIDVTSGDAKIKILKKTGAKLFKDVSEKDWFYEVVMEGKRLGVASGVRDGTYFSPNSPINLASALRMLFKANNIATELTDGTLPPGVDENAWYAKDIMYAVSRSIVTQLEKGGIFPPHKNLRRGELALLLYRFVQSKNGKTFGYASWYGDGLSKLKLTEGLEYAEKHLTAAHKTYPFGTILRVTNMANGKQVDVVVNDRGPFVTGRVVDLSKSAFSAIESPTVGVTSVQVEKVEKIVQPKTPKRKVANPKK